MAAGSIVPFNRVPVAKRNIAFLFIYKNKKIYLLRLSSVSSVSKLSSVNLFNFFL